MGKSCRVIFADCTSVIGWSLKAGRNGSVRSESEGLTFGPVAGLGGLPVSQMGLLNGG